MSGSIPDPATVVARLRAAGCVFAEEEAALLLEAAAEGRDLEAMLARREAGEPLEPLLGWVEFLGRRVVVGRGAFVPRQRTALLVEESVRLVAAGDLVVDLCCGVGAIGAALLAAVPGVEVYAADIEPAAVELARRNLPPDRVLLGDFFAPLPPVLRGRVSLVVCNAPYVPTAAIAFMPPEARDHEPRRALDGGADGLDLHRRLAGEAGAWLRPGGRVVVEASEDQAPVSARIFEAAGFSARIARDDERDATAVIASRSSARLRA